MIPLPMSGRIVSLMFTVDSPFKLAGVMNLILELPENDTTKRFKDIFTISFALNFGSFVSLRGLVELAKHVA